MNRAYQNYFFALLLFSSNGVVASQIDLTSYEIVLLRALLGRFMLIAIFFFTGHRLTALHHRRDLLYLALIMALVAAVLLGETMLPVQIIGAAFIIDGAIFGELAQIGMGRKKTPPI